MIWIPMKARYKSKCAFCPNDINKGDIIRYAKKELKAVHNSCFKKKYKRQ